MKISRQGRIWTATILWIGVACMLAIRGTIVGSNGHEGYLMRLSTGGKLAALAAAIVIGGAKGWFVLSRSAARTARFIERRPEKDWIWMSLHPILYVMIPLMIGLGLGLRHFYGEKYPALIVAVYVGIAVALLVGLRGFHSRPKAA